MRKLAEKTVLTVVANRHGDGRVTVDSMLHHGMTKSILGEESIPADLASFPGRLGPGNKAIYTTRSA